MKWFFLPAVVASTALAVAVPISRQAEGYDIVKTTILKDGQVIDWVRRETQDVNFSLPINYERNKRNNAQIERFASPLPEHLRGPEGTVPIPRRGLVPFPPKKLPTVSDAGLLDIKLKTSVASEDYAGQHWYATAGKQTKITGGGGGFSMFKPYLEYASDFSLLQTGLARYEAKTVEFGTITQSLEVGWMYYPPRGSEPIFFIFFNTNGYQGVGDYLCGWNTEQKGWVQVDDTIYPGMSFDLMSVIGGEQRDFDAKYHLSDGKWWLRAFGKDVGYYPAELFSKKSKKDDTLASYGDLLTFYGEVYNSGPELTTTDMGSGNFPEAGDGNVGYIKNMVYTDGDGKEQKFSGGYTQESDNSRYRIKTFFNSGTSWDSYVYLGGPGANGVVGG